MNLLNGTYYDLILKDGAIVKIGYVEEIKPYPYYRFKERMKEIECQGKIVML